MFYFFVESTGLKTVIDKKNVVFVQQLCCFCVSELDVLKIEAELVSEKYSVRRERQQHTHTQREREKERETHRLTHTTHYTYTHIPTHSDIGKAHSKSRLQQEGDKQN